MAEEGGGDFVGVVVGVGGEGGGAGEEGGEEACACPELDYCRGAWSC